MGRHSAPNDPDRERIDPDQPFDHPHLIGETRPNKIKEMLDKSRDNEAKERDRVVRERGKRN